MANSRKKTSGTEKKTTKRTASNKKGTVKGISVQLECALILFIMVSVFLFASNFGVCGRVGAVISGAMFGIFGILAYIVPVLFAVACFFAVANKNNLPALSKLLFAFLGFLFLCGFVTLVFSGEQVPGIKSAYAAGYLLKRGGGVLGAFVCGLLVPNLGMVGSYLVDIAVILISVVFTTEYSFYEFLKNRGRDVSQSKQNIKEKRLSEGKIHNEYPPVMDSNGGRSKESLLRRNRKVSGVSLNTRIEQGQIHSDDMSELHSNEEYKTSPMIHSMDAPVQTYPDRNLQTDSGVKKEDSRKKERRTGSSLKEKEDALKRLETPEEKVEPMITPVENLSGEQYQFPPLSLLKPGRNRRSGNNQNELLEVADKLEKTLRNFGVRVSVTDVSCGPTVTRFELQPEQGVKVSKIVALADDIKLNLAAADIRIEAPIPGKAAVGIEVPNKENVTVSLRELFETPEFQNCKTKIPFSAGKDIGGKAIVADIAKMPHVLIAGATGSGKSVCINTIVMSILYKARPDEVKLIMIDPKVVELSVYNGIPHLMIPVVTDPKKAAGALNWAVVEMTERYQRFAQSNVRDLNGYNDHVDMYNRKHPDTKLEKMPQIVIIVDELADLMMVAPGDVEDAICRLAQLARAAGIHLILATQRPSVNVITGLIKANMPSRVAFAVSSGVDSRTILDMNGAEKLLGKGDMLFYPQGYQKPLRVQGAFVSDEEVSAVVDFLKKSYQPGEEHQNQAADIEEKVNAMTLSSKTGIATPGAATDDGRDVYFEDAARLLIDKERGSIGMLQRMFKIGFNRAARIMDQLEDAGIVGPEEGTKPRKILVTLEEFEEMMAQQESE